MASKMVWLALAPLLASWGCQAPSIPDPNDPTRPGPDQTRVLQDKLKIVSDAANRRVYNHELTRFQAKVMVNRYEADLCRNIDLSKVSPSDAWVYGQLFLDAQDWENARKILTVAVAHAKDEDRRVNDTLRLAHAYAQLGDVKKAIELSKTTFTTDPQDKAPILPGVLFDVVPSGIGKGSDAELADLLQGAIRQHEMVVVDPHIDSAKLFLAAKPGLISRAWHRVIDLYEAGGRLDLADKALQAAQADVATRKQV